MKKIITQSACLFLMVISMVVFKNRVNAQDIDVANHAMNPQISDVNIFPNPVSNGEMKLSFYVNESSQIRVDIYDSAGNLVETPVNKVISIGPDEELIAINSTLPQGLYILSLRNGNEVDAIKFSVIERGSK
jgi:hypothetical protein